MPNHMFQGPDHTPQCSEADKQAFRDGLLLRELFKGETQASVEAAGFKWQDVKQYAMPKGNGLLPHDVEG